MLQYLYAARRDLRHLVEHLRIRSCSNSSTTNINIRGHTGCARRKRLDEYRLLQYVRSDDSLNGSHTLRGNGPTCHVTHTNTHIEQPTQMDVQICTNTSLAFSGRAIISLLAVIVTVRVVIGKLCESAVACPPQSGEQHKTRFDVVTFQHTCQVLETHQYVNRPANLMASVTTTRISMNRSFFLLDNRNAAPSGTTPLPQRSNRSCHLQPFGSGTDRL